MNNIAEEIFNAFENVIPEHYKTDLIRSSQVQMAMDVAYFLEDQQIKKIMFIEAPVGTGKSLGALIPSTIQKNLNHSINVQYATATINLQSQLMSAEVPLLKKMNLIKQPILAMGKNHYYCHKEFNNYRIVFSPEEGDVLTNFFLKATSGQRNELENIFQQEISDDLWKKVSLKVSKRDCERCEFSYTCPTNIHRKNFMSDHNDLTITNHDQLIRSVLNILSEPRQSPIIPTNPGIIIIDEAHHFIENFLSQLTQSFNTSDLRRIRKYIPPKHIKTYSKLLTIIETDLTHSKSAIEGSLQGRYPVSEDLFTKLGELSKIIKDALANESIKSIGRRIEQYEGGLNNELEELSNTLELFLAKNYVKWINYEEMELCLVSESFPSDFRNFMNHLTKYNKIIVMSGTFTENGNFKTVLNQWRLNEHQVLTKIFTSPFDYKNQALVYVPKNIVPPTNETHLTQSVEILKNLVSLTDGRSLILVTAKKQMDFISTNIVDVLDEKGINLYVQGKGGVETLTKKFKEDISSVLIGSGSFFSGFSVQGDSLISVALTKLPFPVPDDPFLQLIGQGYEDEFFDMIIFPTMMNKLNQAAGRLIRDINDFGVFTVLDSRIFEKDYASKIQSDLSSQGYKITQSYEEVMLFIQRKFKKGSEARYDLFNKEDIIVNEYLWKKPSLKLKVDSKSNIQKTIESSNQPSKLQLDFANEICQTYKIKLPTPSKKKSSEMLYKYLIESLYYEYEDTSIIENNFPYKHEGEKKQLLKIQGNTRKKLSLPKCVDLGCNEVCTDFSKSQIAKYLKDNYNAQDVKFSSHPSRPHCSVMIEPLEIIAKGIV